MNKGIVMDITDKSIVVMRPDGKFERLSRKKRTCEIGEEIVYADSGINWRSSSVAGRSAIAAAVIFCLVLIASFNGKLGSPEVIAYVSMDINPSVELGIDIKETVLELRGLNEDGVDLIQTIEYKGHTLEEVASRLLDKAEQKALAKGEAEIVIASTVLHENDQVSDTRLAEKLSLQVKKHIETTHPRDVGAYQIAAFAAPQEVREAAVQNGVSMGKYTVYLNAKNSGAEVTLDEFKKESVLQISKEKPELAQLIQPETMPTKAEMKLLVEAEKSGQLDKKLAEKLKDKKDNDKGGTSSGPGKSGQSGQNGQSSQNGRNAQNGQNGQNGQQNGKSDPRNPGITNGSPGAGAKDNDKKDDKSNDKKDDRRDNKPTPARPGAPQVNPSNPPTKPGATGPGAVRPGDRSDDRKAADEKKKEDDRKKEEEKRKEEDQKREEARNSEEQRRREEESRRLDAQKKAEEQKKGQANSDRDQKGQDRNDNNRKQDDAKKRDEGKDNGGDNKSKAAEGKQDSDRR